MMPGMSGPELCRTLRSHEGVGFVYIIVLTASTETSSLLDAFEAGADDFLSKPFHRAELLARLEASFRIVKLEEDLAREIRTVRKVNAEMAVLNQKLEQMATTDTLTGLLNRRAVMERLDEYWTNAERHNKPFSCMLLDIDHFKAVNDTHGHDVGDIVLREVAEVLNKHTRADEPVGRIGGEEFLVLCPGSTAPMADVGAERLRSGIEKKRIVYNGLELNVTISAGVAERSEKINNSELFLKKADDALYEAKRNGRNRVCIASEDEILSFENASI
jgi:diguanylate cyclase (GGDEF)-like protein